MARAAVVLLVFGLAAMITPAASAADGTAPVSASGSAGQRLTVSQAEGLSMDGQKITVTGSGYPTFKGVYVAVCKVPPAGQQPTPCGGGADMSGSSETSSWISSKPPSYAKGLTVPYGKGGTFEVTVWAAPELPNGESCTQVACAVVSRADHTRTSDRSQDVLIPVTFGSTSSHDGGIAALVYVVIAIALVALIGAVTFALLRRRRRLHEPSAVEPDADASPARTDA